LKKHNLSKSRNFRSTRSKIKGRGGGKLSALADF